MDYGVAQIQLLFIYLFILFLSELLSRLVLTLPLIENTPESVWIFHFFHHFMLSLISLHDVLIDQTRSHCENTQTLTQAALMRSHVTRM